MATLVFKVSTLFIKQAAKPLANRFQAYVINHPVLRKQVLSLTHFPNALTEKRLFGSFSISSRPGIGQNELHTHTRKPLV